jgi:signal transduction histidine kinase
MTKNTNNRQSAFHPNSLFLRTALPLTLLIVCFVLTGFYISHESTRGLYNHIAMETLKNDAFFARALLNDSHKTVQEKTPGLSLGGQQVAVTEGAKEKMLLLLNRPSHGLLLLDGNGKILLNTRSDKPTGSNINIRELLENKTSFILARTTDDGVILAHTYYQPLDIYIVVFNNQSFTQAPFYRGMVSSSYVFMSTMTAGVLLIIYMLLNAFVLRPVTRLNTSMRDIIEQDNFEHHNVVVTGSNELAQVARLFNTLLHHLRDRDSKLQDHRERLEDLVTERTQKLIDVQERMVQHERLAAIGEFSSSIAHELRNPLTSIKMGVEQIVPMLPELDAKNLRRVELVQAEITRLDSMLKGILAFAANTPTEVEPHELKDILAQGTPTFTVLANDNGVTLDTIGFNMACTVSVDKNKLLQALINLVKNACEAHSGDAPIRISASHDTDTAKIQIQNGGKPIPADVRDRLFEPFFTTKTDGTGLGLPTTKRLLEEMDASISIESTPALGTIATITLKTAK